MTGSITMISDSEVGVSCAQMIEALPCWRVEGVRECLADDPAMVLRALELALRRVSVWPTDAQGGCD
ncbi:MAG: hypothetical protein AAFX65_13565 [Cyanobacteria bacterium J06638_7]